MKGKILLSLLGIKPPFLALPAVSLVTSDGGTYPGSTSAVSEFGFVCVCVCLFLVCNITTMNRGHYKVHRSLLFQISYGNSTMPVCN
jgi:hypothetical protein